MTMAREPRESYAPITQEDLDALRRYADKHGRRWKLQLWAEWMNASAEPTLPCTAQHPRPHVAGSVPLAGARAVRDLSHVQTRTSPTYPWVSSCPG